MQLIQPRKKNYDVSLDMTMQVDANEELRDEFEEGKTNLAHKGTMLKSGDFDQHPTNLDGSTNLLL